MQITMKHACKYMVIFFNFSLTLNHFYSLQAENCDSNSRLVVDEEDNGKFRLKGLTKVRATLLCDNSFINPLPADHDYCRF